MTRTRVLDLSPATEAFVPHAMDNLERADKFGGEFSSLRPFVLEHDPRNPLALSAYAIARSTQFLGELELNIAFPGPRGAKFRSEHQKQLIDTMSAALEAGGWEIIPVDNGYLASTSSDGIFFTVMRPEVQASPAE